MGSALTALAMVLLAISVLMHENRIRKAENQLKQWELPEDRCRECADRESCPAAFTGVIYPCEHFRKEDKNGEQE